MSERIRFHLDENVDPAIALGLRRYGIDVTTTNDVELRTQSDEVQLAFIQEAQRVLFTQDADFLIIASSRLDHPGITYCKKGTRSIGEIIENLVLMYEVMTPEEMWDVSSLCEIKAPLKDLHLQKHFGESVRNCMHNLTSSLYFGRLHL
ncbi:DUF5615 family PIN-like protein [Nostoc sp. CHAB 5784]|uniref:DUF5615 family PIN-like protein n=1 Tax=Nostoc mirabile TaxID=2907820 RepID=UPI001E639C7E|nr:DUF5615 family PIN-like protein [Nostoc mirabile]MCC5663497.1 DUF5615 family PIN-like protein [Nostoc mirabile CHAB5784]